VTGCGTRTPGRFARWRTGLLAAGLGLFATGMLSGCDRDGPGSVNWKDNPKARPVGMPPKGPEKPSRPSRPSPDKSKTYHPG
jgi:hypothetical protein